MLFLIIVSFKPGIGMAGNKMSLRLIILKILVIINLESKASTKANPKFML